MKNIIYTLSLLILPMLGWAQFEDFVKIEYTTKGPEKTLNYEIFPCDLETKVIVHRTAAKENNLSIEFKNFYEKSIEKQVLTIGSGTNIKSFGLKNHLVILTGTVGGGNKGSVLTGAIVIPYNDKKAIMLGEYKTNGKYKPGLFMSKRTVESFKELENSIIFQDRGKLQLFNLSTKTISPVDLNLKRTQKVYNIIPSAISGAAHVLIALTKNMKNIKILTIGSNGTVERTHILDENITEDINKSSLKFYEEAGNYYAAGLIMNASNSRIIGIRYYTYKNGKTEIKNFGFKSNESFELTPDFENTKKSKLDYTGDCDIQRVNGQTFILYKFFSLKLPSPGIRQKVFTPSLKLNCIQLDNENNITAQSSLIEIPTGVFLKKFSAIYNKETETINYLSADPYSYYGLSFLSFNIEKNNFSNELLFDGYIASPIIIDSSHVFFIGYFRDGKPYTLQYNAEDAEAYPACGVLEF